MKCVRLNRWFAAVAVNLALIAIAAAKDAQPTSVTPVPHKGDAATKRQDAINARIKKGNVDLIFVGDSITQGWEGAGKQVWQKYYVKRNAANLGIGGDQTQHVLWRLDHGNLAGIAPKLAVVMIGTNNAGNKQKPEVVAAGVNAVVKKLRDKLPQTKILLLAIFPRGANKQDPVRQVNAKVNALIARSADNKQVFFVDIGPKFLNADGTISKDVMPDLLHLTPKSYETWAVAIEPMVKRLMGEAPPPRKTPKPAAAPRPKAKAK